MNNIMLDIETLGVKPGCVILSIGAVQFDFDGNVGKHFHQKLNYNQSIKTFYCDKNTVNWWKITNKELYESLIQPIDKSNDVVLIEFIDWIKSLNIPIEKLYIWGNGKEFDISILSYYLDFYMIDAVWKSIHEMDVRTIVAINPDIKRGTEFVGTKHNPIDDCKHQIKYLTQTIKNHIKYE